MKTKRRLVTILSILTYITVTPAMSMEGGQDNFTAHEARLTYDNVQREVREKRLSVALTDILGMKVNVQDDVVVLKGSETHIEEAFNRLNDFHALRQKVMPFNPDTIVTQATQSADFKNWHDCMIALGIQPELMRNFAIHSNLDEAGTLKIPYTSEPDRMLADVYLSALKKQSPYLDWILKHNHEVITETATYKIIHYGLLREHLCKVEIQQEPTDVPDEFEARLSVITVLMRLTAAAGQDLSLESTSKLGEYHVRTVMLGRAATDQHVSVIPTIEIVIDYSTSMNEESGGSSLTSKIDVVNTSVPILLKQFRDSLKSGESLKINVKKFNHELADHANYILTYADPTPIQWIDIVLAGGTDLTKVGNLLKLKDPDERKVVVAFTDGKHEVKSSSIEDNMKELKKLQESGLFAEPSFFRVGVRDPQNDNYLPNVSGIFSGSFQEQVQMSQFFQKVTGDIPYLLESKQPIILSLGESMITIRQPDAYPDIHTTEQTVNVQSVITHRGVEHYVVPKKPNTDPAVTATFVPEVGNTAEAFQARIRELEAQFAAVKLEKEVK